MKARTAVIIGVVALLVAGIIALIEGKRAATTRTKPQAANIPAAMQQVRQVNVSLPERQTQAKMLIMAAHIQKKIPEASNWCERLNASGSIWPAIPTNTVFAINTNLAGKAFTRDMSGDAVVFFESVNSGWNQAGGAELLAANADGVTVALADGRAIIVSPVETTNLRWTP